MHDLSQLTGAESCPFAKYRFTKAVRQPQRIEHEFEDQIVPGQWLRQDVSASRLDRVHVLQRIRGLCIASYAARVCHFAVRTGPDGQVVAEQPVVEIMPARRAVTRIGRDLVLPIPAFRQQRLPPVLNLVRRILVRQVLRRAREEYRIRFERQLVPGNVRGLETDRGTDILNRRRNVLAWQACMRSMFTLSAPAALASFTARTMSLLL